MSNLLRTQEETRNILGLQQANIKGLKAKKVRFFSTSSVANNADIETVMSVIRIQK